MSGSLLERIDVAEILRDIDYEEALAGTELEDATEDENLGERLGARAGEWLGSALGALLGQLAGELVVGGMLDKVGGDEAESSGGDQTDGSPQEANA